MVTKLDGDFITINTKDRTKKTAELISKFKIPNLGEYVIYKIDKMFYGAKYNFNGEETLLDTNLTDIEKKVLNETFYQLGVK